jgi:DNA-binding MarR family transcriptional regulator
MSTVLHDKQSCETHNGPVPTKADRRRTPTRTAAAEPPAAEAWRLLFKQFFARKDMFLAVAESCGLRPGDVRLLLMLEAPRPMRDVARLMTCDPSTLTGMVDRLEGVGYVERRPDAGDRRVKIVALTDSGALAREEVVAKLQATPEQLLRLSVADQRTLRDLVRKAFAPE